MSDEVDRPSDGAADEGGPRPPSQPSERPTARSLNVVPSQRAADGAMDEGG